MIKLPLLDKKIHRFIYIFGLILLSVSLPLSLYFTSLAQLLLLANWIFEGELLKKWQIFKSRKGLIVISSVYLIHLIGLLYTRDFNWGMHDIRIKLPLLALPVIIGTTEMLTRKELKSVLIFFILAVLTGSLISLAVYLKIIGHGYSDIREISIFISHIRFALLIVLAISISWYFIIFDYFSVSAGLKYFLIFVMIWLVIFLFILKSLTGVIILYFIIPLIYSFRIKVKSWQFERKIFPFLVLIYFFLGGTYLYIIYRDFRPNEQISAEKLPVYTANGNLYEHHIDSRQLENGNYCYIYLCYKELRQQWNEISKFDFDSTDQKGHLLSMTLIRYLTSRGFTKDSVGISKLTSEDIKRIENGIPNYIYAKKLSFYPRIYQMFWEIDILKKEGYASGHSLALRIVYLKTAAHIIKNHLWLGVGTGDVVNAYNDEYEASASPLESKWRARAHNQYITFILTFGIIGGLWILIAFILPLFFEKKQSSYLAVIFLVIVMLSMLNEDTLETHTGVSLFGYFYGLFIFGIQNAKDESSETR